MEGEKYTEEGKGIERKGKIEREREGDGGRRYREGGGLGGREKRENRETGGY